MQQCLWEFVKLAVVLLFLYIVNNQLTQLRATGAFWPLK